MGISFVNPDTDLFSSGLCSPNYLEDHFPLESYDIVHIHFSFDRLSLEELESVLKYFKENSKPIVWTLHSKESQRIRNYGEGKYQKLLFDYSDKIICPTMGAMYWLEEKYGKHKRAIDIIPLGYMSDPRDIQRLGATIKKDPLLFTMLIGDFRQNREFIQSIVNFLQCSDLNNYKLQLIFKPIFLYEENGLLSTDMSFFYQLIQNPRIEILSRPEISNDELNSSFLKSFAIILSYKWGTHSGQIEQARDCGCHVVVSDVGFYKEQWNKVVLYNINDKNGLETAKNYTNSLIEVTKYPSLLPAGMSRLEEHHESVSKHVTIYDDILREFGNR